MMTDLLYNKVDNMIKILNFIKILPFDTVYKDLFRYGSLLILV